MVAKVKAKRSAIAKRDGFGVIDCTACALRCVCGRSPNCLGCSIGINERAAKAQALRERNKGNV